jgi:predicted DNA binding protein
VVPAAARSPRTRVRRTASQRFLTGPRSGPVGIGRLRVPLPESAWIARFSSLHPEVRIEVLSRLDIGHRRSLTELRLHAPEARSLADELRALPQVEAVEELEGGPTETHFRVVNRTSEFIPIFRELNIMRRFPFSIQAGVGTWVVVAPKATIRRLLDRLHEQVPAAALEAVHPAGPSRSEGSLTPRQEDLLRRAMAAGYFEVPRRISLTALAKNLGIAPSTLSESLAKVEKKLLEQREIPD